MNISENGKNLIKKYEGCRLIAYQCPAGVWTIGYGHTGKDVYKGLIISQDHADSLFNTDIKKYEAYVQKYNGLNQNMFDALCSFAYNCGQGALNDVMNSGNVTNTMSLYVHAAGTKLLGLVNRRAEEIKLFNTPMIQSTNSKRYLNLRPTVERWRVYPTNKSPKIGNEIGFLAPKKFGGLSYEILGSTQSHVYTILTQNFGIVNIYAPWDADSAITTTALY